MPLGDIAAARAGGVPQDRIERIAQALMAQLDAMHRDGRVHGGISPRTVLLDDRGNAVLAEPPGPVRPVSEAAAAVLAPGYAAFEQYTDDPDWTCGPWTDVYGLSAVLHLLVRGAAPPRALRRCLNDNYEPLAGMPGSRYSPSLLAAIDAGLARETAARPQDMGAFAAAAAVAMGPARPIEDWAAPVPPPSEPPPADTPQPPRPRLLPVLLTVALIAAAALWWWRQALIPTRGLPAWTASQPVQGRGGPAPAEPPPSGPTVEASAGVARQSVGAGGSVRSTSRPAAAESGRVPVAPPALGDASREPAPSGGRPDPVRARPAGKQQPEAPAAPRADSRGAAAPGIRGAARAPAAAEAPVAVPPRSAAGGRPLEGLAAAPPARPGRDTAGRVAGHGRATVALDIRPWGEVLVDGASQGVSPPMKTLTLPPGRYRFEVRNSTLAPHVAVLELQAGQAAVLAHTFE